jgi:hypothetical protein
MVPQQHETRVCFSVFQLQVSVEKSNVEYLDTFSVCSLYKLQESIAIPLLGTGNNGAPVDFVIELLCDAIDEFVGQQKTLLHLQSVCIVHPDKQVQKIIGNRIEKLKNCSPKRKLDKQGENKTKPKFDD